MLTLLLSVAGWLVLLVSVFISFRTRFIQFRALPELFRLFFYHQSKTGEGTICARRALLTAMSTTIGLSTMVAPVIAIRLGGPGAVVGFFLATIFGAAASYAEVTFAVEHRKKVGNKVFGGPMQYLQKVFSPALAKAYALGCVILMLVWSSAQANQVAGLFDGASIGFFSIPTWITGLLLTAAVTGILVGGINRVAACSAKLVPIMFCLYLGASIWIIGCHIDLLPQIFSTIFKSCFEPQVFAGGVVCGGLSSAFRWGVLKALHGTEAGVGTQTIPHSAAEVNSASQQGILAMASTYSAGLIMIISSLTALISSTWLDLSLNLGIDMVMATFEQAFSIYGTILVAISAILFGFGTILGNGYNGSVCFGYLTKGKYTPYFYGLVALMVFLGAIADVQLVWSYVDIVLAFVMVPHAIAIFILAARAPKLAELVT
jgi:AGCS family alanine or glycine:cation symporter